MDGLLQMLMEAAGDMSGSSESAFQLGDVVQINLPPDVVEDLQTGHGEWVEDMKNILNVNGSVTTILPNGDCMVSFENSRTFRINSIALTRMAEESSNLLRPGDIVQIEGDPDKIRQLQENFGGCNHLMVGLAGMYGYVVSRSLRQFIVRNGPRKWSWNPQVLTKITTQELDTFEQENSRVTRFNLHDLVHIINDSDVLERNQENYGGWVPGMAYIKNKYGFIKLILPNGSIRVQVQGKKWVLNPRSCRLVIPANKTTNEIVNRTFKAAQEDPQETISILIRSNPKDSLFHCVLDGTPKQFEQRVLKGEDPRQLLDGYSVLHAAVSCCENIEMMETILKHAHDLLTKGDSDGNKPMHLAAAAGRVENVKFLLRQDESTYNARNSMGQSPLHKAVWKKSKDCAVALVNGGAPINMKDTQSGDTALHDCITFDVCDIGEYLVELGAKLTMENNQGFNPFFLSALKGNERLFRCILNAPNMSLERASILKGDGFTVAHVLAINNHHNLLNDLMAKYPTYDLAVIDMNGLTALHLAALQSHMESVRTLLRHGANPNAQDFDNDTPLHVCFKKLDKKKSLMALLQADDDKKKRINIIARCLISYGADPYLINNESKTALQIAANSDPELCSLLMEKHEKYVKSKETLKQRVVEDIADNETSSSSSSSRTTSAAGVSSFSTRSMQSNNKLMIDKKKKDFGEFSNPQQTNQEEEGTCRICYDFLCDVQLPCGHEMCRPCAEKVYECPYCRSDFIYEDCINQSI